MDYIVALLGLAVVHLLAAASPGPSTVLVVQTAAVGGRRGGLIAAVAMMMGATAWALQRCSACRRCSRSFPASISSSASPAGFT